MDLTRTAAEEQLPHMQLLLLARSLIQPERTTLTWECLSGVL